MAVSSPFSRSISKIAISQSVRVGKKLSSSKKLTSDCDPGGVRAKKAEAQTYRVNTHS